MFCELVLIFAQHPIPHTIVPPAGNILMADIHTGDYQPVAPIPSEPQLAKDDGIGRLTVRQAIDVLGRKCLLSQRPTRGPMYEQKNSR